MLPGKGDRGELGDAGPGMGFLFIAGAAIVVVLLAVPAIH
jgi:hypothetical protein